MTQTRTQTTRRTGGLPPDPRDTFGQKMKGLIALPKEAE